MTIDIHESNFESDTDKILQLTTAGANKASISFHIRSTNPEGEGKGMEIILQKTEALLVAETIRIYFEHTV